MKKHDLRGFRYLILLIALISLMIACHRHDHRLSRAKSTAVKDSVSQMASNIARDISAKGPITWLNYFEDSPDFFMASNGALVFHDHQSAKIFIQDTLIRMITKINLQWSHLRIDPLTSSIAAMGAVFHEDITYANGKTSPADGYFTATAHLTPNGWKLRNANWSIKTAQ